jgi:hypothetical protein
MVSILNSTNAVLSKTTFGSKPYLKKPATVTRQLTKSIDFRLNYLCDFHLWCSRRNFKRTLNSPASRIQIHKFLSSIRINTYIFLTCLSTVRYKICHGKKGKIMVWKILVYWIEWSPHFKKFQRPFFSAKDQQSFYRGYTGSLQCVSTSLAPFLKQRFCISKSSFLFLCSGYTN